MSKGEKIDTPDWALTAAEKIQSFGDQLPLSGLIRLFVGSSSPAYVQAQWRTAKEVISSNTGRPAELPLAKADPEAPFFSFIPRFKNTAALLGAYVYELDEILEDNNAQPAVAYTYRSKTHAGILPEGIHSLSMPPASMYYRAALRLGKSDMGAAIGGWLEDEKVFIKPDTMPHDTTVIQNVHIEELPPGVPLL